MTIWLLTVLLMASVAALGYRQGAIRVACSSVGIVIGALLAVPVGGLVRPLFKLAGLQQPLLLYLIPPVAAFVLFSIIFKVMAQTAHHKVDVYYKYRAGDLRLALWERLNARLGLCLGVLNGVVYMILLSFVIFTTSYATVQVASSNEDPLWMRLLNRLGKDLEVSGMTKVAGALDSRKLWYDAADMAGLLYHNPLLEARLSRYPAFLGISERPEFKDLGGDKDFTELRLGRAPILSVIKHPKAQTILNNRETLLMLWSILVQDMPELETYLRTGLSQKYDQEKLVGRWLFDARSAMAMKRRSKANMTSREAQEFRRWLETSFAQTSFVAMTDQQGLLKDLPVVLAPTATPGQGGGQQTLQCRWKGGGGSYTLTFSGGLESMASVDGDRMKLNYDGLDLAFSREM